MVYPVFEDAPNSANETDAGEIEHAGGDIVKP